MVLLQAMGIQRYMFFSIHNCDKHPEVPLMQMKTCTEQYLKESGLNYTIFRLCGFMQVWLHCQSLHVASATYILACVSGQSQALSKIVFPLLQLTLTLLQPRPTNACLQTDL